MGENNRTNPITIWWKGLPKHFSVVSYTSCPVESNSVISFFVLCIINDISSISLPCVQCVNNPSTLIDEGVILLACVFLLVIQFTTFDSSNIHIYCTISILMHLLSFFFFFFSKFWSHDFVTPIFFTQCQLSNVILGATFPLPTWGSSEPISCFPLCMSSPSCFFFTWQGRVSPAGCSTWKEHVIPTSSFYPPSSSPASQGEAV